ncbi:predicted protein, partial [Nematostella vectensis]
DGKWGAWSDWGSCSASCGPGKRIRTRECNDPAPKSGGKMCEGAKQQTGHCEFSPCPTDGSWSSWTEWSDCTQECGDGVRTRSRYCDNPSPAAGGSDCAGKSEEYTYCKKRDCCE